jgi:hypothetical protein
MDKLSNNHNTANDGNILLSAVIGAFVKHSEQKYTGFIKSDLGNGYCMVELDKPDLKLLYPFGIKAKVDKLVYYSR